jgi:hypothetical protein
MRYARAVALSIGCGLISACGPSHVVVLRTTPHATPGPLLEVVVRNGGIVEPLRISRGSRVAYAGLEEPLERAIADAAQPWALQHAAERPGGWQLLVELTRAEAKRRGEQISLVLGVRATLRSHQGNVYLAQTQSHCEEADRVLAKDAAPLFYRCMGGLGHELAGWLGSVRP